MDIFLIYIIKTLILPPASLLILALLGLIIHNKRQKLGICLIALSLLALTILSLPLVSFFLTSTQEIYPAINNSQLRQTNARAIVVLGGGTRISAPEYNDQTIIHNRVFDRLRYAVRLAKKTGLPLLVSGGKVVDRNQPSEAELMQETLTNDFQFKAIWLEDKSRNTAENAYYSYALLNKEKITQIILVTHALHMARAVQQFQNAGFQVTPAPTAFIPPLDPITVLDLIPSAPALNQSSFALHELLGRWWYRFRYI
jgi:uncharacterized SAM-binding protein YcdF (DUF218 family)